MPVKLYVPPGWLTIGELSNKLVPKRSQADCMMEEILLTKEEGLGLPNHPSSMHYKVYDIRDFGELNRIAQCALYPMTFSLEEIRLSIFQGDIHQHLFAHRAQGLRWIIQSEAELIRWKSIFACRALVRDGLASSKLKASALHDNHYSEIPATVWHADENWYRLLAEGSLNTRLPGTQNDSQIQGVVFFKVADVYQFLQSLMLVIGSESQLIAEFYKKHESGDLKLRAALKLMIQTILSLHGDYLDKSKKNVVEDDIRRLTTQMGFKILTRQQDIALEKKSNPRMEDTCVSEADIKSIATCLRNLSKQV